MDGTTVSGRLAPKLRAKRPTFLWILPWEYFSTDSKHLPNLRLSYLSRLELITKCNQNTANEM